MVTTDYEARNMRLLAHSDLGGFGRAGEGVGLHAKGGRRTLFVAHERGPKKFTGIDVTDPRAPRVVCQTDLPGKGRANSLSIVDDLMAVAYQSEAPGAQPAGFEMFDISNPANPRRLSAFDASGPHSRGAHFVNLDTHGFVYAACGMPDWEPARALDHQFVVIIDVRDPSKPKEAGRWWLPGQRKGEAPLRYNEQRITPHNINVYPERPDRAYVGYCDAGVIILDISDKAHPKLVSRFDYHPPMIYGFTHTVVPLFERGLLVVADEASDPRGPELQGPEGWTDGAGFDDPKLVWLMDGRYEPQLVPLSTLPMPPLADFKWRGGNYGAHNIHENDPGPTSFRSDQLIFGTFFNAGVRAYDIRDSLRPAEVGYFIPPAPARSALGAPQINDVYVDENRTIYVLERTTGGLYILELTA